MNEETTKKCLAIVESALDELTGSEEWHNEPKDQATKDERIRTLADYTDVITALKSDLFNEEEAVEGHYIRAEKGQIYIMARFERNETDKGAHPYHFVFINGAIMSHSDYKKFIAQCGGLTKMTSGYEQNAYEAEADERKIRALYYDMSAGAKRCTEWWFNNRFVLDDGWYFVTAH